MMREILDRILEGNYIAPTTGLEFSCTKVDFELSCDCDFEGSFRVFSDDAYNTEGVVVASDSRMELLTSKISGCDSEIIYHFHGDLCEPGDVIKGYFSIISDHGEYQIPFIVNVLAVGIATSVGIISDINGFTNLAKSNWYEALDLFYSADFIKLLSSSEDLLPIYEALSVDSGNSQNLEEFLISTGKKQRTDFIASKKEISINLNVREFGENLLEREIEIIRNGWGFSNLRIRWEGDFLFTERTGLSDEDFNGNICAIKIFVDSKKCHKGKNEGKIIFYNNFVRFEVPVEVSSSFDLTVRRIARTRAMLLIQVVESYLSYSLNKIGTVEFIDMAGRIIEQLTNMDETDAYAKLMHANVLILEKRYNEASWLIDQAAELVERKQKEKKISAIDAATVHGYHWYLTSLLKQDREFNKVAASKVEALLNKNPDGWMLAIVALHMPTTFTASDVTRWHLLEDVYNRGCRSPIIYLEGMRILNENPGIIRSLKGFALQVVHYGAKNKSIEAKCFDYIVELAVREKAYSPLLYKTLELIYRDYKDIAVVQAICGLLIRSGRRDDSAAEWYRLGVDAQLKINGLFEYYIQSIDLRKETDIPVMVLMYFSYQNNLDYERQAYLYHYLIDHRQQLADVYESNRTNMEEFAVSQLTAGRINRDLAVIYDHVVRPELLSRQMALAMADLLFSNLVICSDSKYKKVYVYRKECQEPWEYKLTDGVCILPVFGNAYTIVFEDEQGNRYIDSAKYEIEKLMHIGKYLQPVSDLVWDNERLNLYIVGSGQQAITVTKDNISRFLQLAESNILRKSIRQETLIMCLEYFSINDNQESRDRCLDRLDMSKLSASQRNRLFSILFKAERYEVLDEWICKFGPYFTKPSNVKKYLEKILTPQYAEANSRPEKHICYAASYVFADGNPGSLVTSYMAQNYYGTTAELRDVWNKLGAYEMPRNAVNKRILSQLLVTGAQIPEKRDIAKEYISQNPDTDLARAVVYSQCLDYFVNEILVDESTISYAYNLYVAGENLPKSVKLAFLKYYSAYPAKMNDEIRNAVILLLKEQIEDRVYLSFFKEYLNSGAFPGDELRGRLETVLEELEDRTIVDFKSTPGMSAKIHYIISKDGSSQDEYIVETMREVCGGVCFKDFVLFFGENLEYYISEERDGQTSLGDTGNIQCNDVTSQKNLSKYELINEMIVSNTVKDYVRFDNLIEEYYQKEYVNSELFRLF